MKLNNIYPLETTMQAFAVLAIIVVFILPTGMDIDPTLVNVDETTQLWGFSAITILILGLFTFASTAMRLDYTLIVVLTVPASVAAFMGNPSASAGLLIAGIIFWELPIILGSVLLCRLVKVIFRFLTRKRKNESIDAHQHSSSCLAVSQPTDIQYARSGDDSDSDRQRGAGRVAARSGSSR